MKLITGIGDDGRQPNQHTPELSSLTCGEKGLFAEPAFRAGLPPKTDNKTSRVIHYLNTLKPADNGQRFYGDSLNTDPIATAETLLN